MKRNRTARAAAGPLPPDRRRAGLHSSSKLTRGIEALVKQPQPKSHEAWNVSCRNGYHKEEQEGGNDMRGISMLVVDTALVGDVALAQTAAPNSDHTNNPAANSAASSPTTAAPTQPQPQGHPGPIDTTSGGTPASSPQGIRRPECNPTQTIAKRTSVRSDDRRHCARRARQTPPSCEGSYSAGVTAGCRCVSFGPVRACSSSSQRLWCSLAQLTSTVPLPMASNAPSIPTVPI